MSLVGQHIGRYRIVEPLGQGGMSVVYKALDTSLERVVAIKVLHPHLAHNEDSRKRLAREARAVARLQHPNILEVYDFSSVDAEMAYLVTEYIRGQTLREYLLKNPFAPPESAALVSAQLAAALAHAHGAGIVHRDLKAENVMIREDGLLKLMDFGIARLLDRDDRMTLTGSLVGSPAHMAPEIIEGEEATPASDVFSLGTLLYLLVTSELPFTGPNTSSTLRRILDGVYVDPRQKVPTVSDELAEVIARCLRRKPSDRYESAAALHAALADTLRALAFGPLETEWLAYHRDPVAHRAHLVPRMTEALLARAEASLSEKRPARALSHLSQILALEPQHPGAHRLMERMNRRRLLKRRAQWMGGGILAATGLGLLLSSIPGQVERPVETPASQTVPPAPVAVAPSVPPPVALPSTPVEKKKATVDVETPMPPLVELTVNIRPWGHLRVDNDPPDFEEKPRHVLKVRQGLHRLIISCEKHCVEEGTEVSLDVTSSSPRVLNVPAPLKPSRIVFSGFPDEAVVTVGPLQREVKDIRLSPIEVVMPKEGSTQMGHRVVYEVSLPGHKPFLGQTWVAPGTLESIEGRLDPE